jgi:hypothetical protein
VLISATLALGVLAPVAPGAEKPITAEQRKTAIRRAQVWMQTNVASMDIKAGPRRKDGFAPGETVTCEYTDVKLGGNSPKFACLLGEDRLKVRYGRTNGEVFATVAATRLLWALGFGADAAYPVHVVCYGCPGTLVGDGVSGAGETRFDAATVEWKMHGEEMEAPGVGSGWAWPELDQVDEATGGAPAAQRDALKLLAVMLQHTDSKPEQQRLLCLDDRKKGEDVRDGKKTDGKKKHEQKDKKKETDALDCVHPFMMIHDVGLTFGGGNLLNRQAPGSVNLDEWRSAAVWKDAAHCIGNLPASQTGTLVDPKISEPGRRFLADRLEQLSDDQLRDLFLVARFADRLMPGGKSEGTKVDQWVEVFKKKRAEIAAARCAG